LYCCEEKVLDETVRLIIPSHPRYIRVVRGIIAESAGLAGFSDKERHAIALATAEGCSNIIKHSYENDYSRRIVLKCRVREGEVEVTLRDFGKQVDLDTIKPRKLEEIRPGGLGVHLMQSLVDEVRYRHCKMGTELKLIKRRKDGEKRDEDRTAD